MFANVSSCINNGVITVTENTIKGNVTEKDNDSSYWLEVGNTY